MDYSRLPPVHFVVKLSTFFVFGVTYGLLTSLEARADEIAAVERTIEELTVDRLKPA